MRRSSRRSCCGSRETPRPSGTRSLALQMIVELKRPSPDPPSSTRTVTPRFGKAGNWYFEIARGQDDRPVQPDRERKSSGSETTFPEDLIDPVRIEAGVIAMADDVWAWCEKTNCRGRTVTVKIKWADFQVSSRSRSIETPIETRDKLHELALELIRTVFPPQKGIRLVGVTLSNFRLPNMGADAELPEPLLLAGRTTQD